MEKFSLLEPSLLSNIFVQIVPGVTRTRTRLHWKPIKLKARFHRRFLSRQLDAIFVARKFQLQNRTCKPGAIFSTICRRDTAGVSNMFETRCSFSATKIASSCRDKNQLCKRALSLIGFPCNRVRVRVI